MIRLRSRGSVRPCAAVAVLGTALALGRPAVAQGVRDSVRSASLRAASLRADSARTDSARADSLRRASRAGMIPPGYGSLRQDDLAVQVQILGLTVKVIPLDEGIIRTLAPDSYNALRKLRDDRAKQLEAIRLRMGLPSVQAWYVTFTNGEQGEARYDPTDFLMRSGGRDFHPLDVLRLKPGFGDGRLAQRSSQSAVYVFDPAINLGQDITVTIGTQTAPGWTDVLRAVERERSLAWSRAGAAAGAAAGAKKP